MLLNTLPDMPPNTLPNKYAPIVILMRPQIGENIGMAARAMFNCGLSELRIVKPRQRWPNPAAIAAAKKADIVIEKAQLFASLEDAVADCEAIYASSARLREINIPVISPAQAAEEILAANRRGVARSALLFGPENNGLDNDSLAIADRLVHADLNKECPSLNLAQAVFLLAWEWWKVSRGEKREEARNEVGCEISEGGVRKDKDGSQPANKGEMLAFLVRLEGELTTRGFFRSIEQKPEMRKNLRALAMRARPSKQELRTLQGVVSVLGKSRRIDGDYMLRDELNTIGRLVPRVRAFMNKLNLY